MQKNYQVVYGNQNWNTSVTGVTQEYMSIRDLKITTGSFITEDDMNTRNRVAVIGMTVASNLFGEANPVGKTIRVNNQPYRVIGVLESKGQSSVGQDQDDVVIVPLTTAMDRLVRPSNMLRTTPWISRPGFRLFLTSSMVLISWLTPSRA